MPKIPTFTAQGSIEQLQGSTTTPQINLNSTLATALAPVTKMVVNQKIQETNAQNQAEALKLENNFITDFIKVSETINTDEVMSVNKDVANKYLKNQSNALINKYKSLASISNSYWSIVVSNSLELIEFKIFTLPIVSSIVSN